MHSALYWFCVLKNSVLGCKRNNKPFEILENISSLQQRPVSDRGFQGSFCTFQSLATLSPSHGKFTADSVYSPSPKLLPRSRTGLYSILLVAITTSLLRVFSPEAKQDTSQNLIILKCTFIIYSICFSLHLHQHKEGSSCYYACTTSLQHDTRPGLSATNHGSSKYVHHLLHFCA